MRKTTSKYFYLSSLIITVGLLLTVTLNNKLFKMISAICWINFNCYDILLATFSENKINNEIEYNYLIIANFHI